jgi:hypothetical protein
VTFFEEKFFYFLFYLFIFSVTNNGILTCGISLDSEKLSLSKSEYKNIFVPSYLKKQSGFSSDLELFFERKLVYVVVIVLLK